MNALEKLKLSKELRGLLGGMDGLKAMEKLKAAKRVRELVALLGGGDSAVTGYVKVDTLPQQQEQLARLFPIIGDFIKFCESRGKHADINWSGGGCYIADLKSSWFVTLDLTVTDAQRNLVPPVLQVVKKNIPGGKPPSVEIVAEFAAIPENFEKAFEKALSVVSDLAIEQEESSPAEDQTPSNPLYQSVIDGAEITLPLIEQVIEEAEKNGDDANNDQLVEVARLVQQWAIDQGMVA